MTDIFQGKSAREKQYELQSLAPKIVKSYPNLHGYLHKEVIPSRAALQQNLQIRPPIELTPALKKSLAKKKRKRRRVRNIRGELAQIKRAQKRFERGERRDPLHPEKEPRLVAEPEQQRGVNINLVGGAVPAAGAVAGGAVAAGAPPPGAVAPPPVPVVPPAPVAVNVGVPAADIDRIRAGIRADVAADIAGVHAEVRRARAAGQQAVQAVGALAPQVRAQRAAAEEAAARAEHVRVGIVEQNVAQAERDAARDAREAERQAAVERGFETLAQDIEERADAQEARELQAQQRAGQIREQQASAVEAVRARGEAIHQQVAGEIGGLRAAVEESAGIVQQLRDNPVRDEQQIREEQERYDALTATLAGLNTSNDAILATMRGAGGLVRREVAEDIERFDSRAAAQQEEVSALGSRLAGIESTLAAQRDSGVAAAEDLRQRESVAGQARRAEALAERERRDREFEQLVEGINDRLGQQDQGIQQTLERVRVSEERRPGEFEELLRQQIGSLEGRLDRGLHQQIVDAIAEGQQRRRRKPGPRGGGAQAGGAQAVQRGERGGKKDPQSFPTSIGMGGVGVGGGPPKPGAVSSDGLNTTLRDSALTLDPVALQGTLGDGNLLTDSQRAQFEAEFGPSDTQRGRGGTEPEPELRDKPPLSEEPDTPRGGKKRKGTGKGRKGGVSPRGGKFKGGARRTGGGYKPVDADESGRRSSRNRSDDFEGEPPSTGVGGGKPTGGKKPRGRPKGSTKGYRVTPGPRESVSDADLRASNSLWDDSLQYMSDEAGQRGRRALTDDRLKLRLRNTSRGVWDQGGSGKIEGGDVVDITGWSQDGRIRLRNPEGPGKQGPMVQSRLIQEALKRGDLILEKGRRRDLGGWYSYAPFGGTRAGGTDRETFEHLVEMEDQVVKRRHGTDDPDILRAQGLETGEQRVLKRLKAQLDKERQLEERRKRERDEMRRADLAATAKIGAVRQDPPQQVAADIAAVEEQAQRREADSALTEQELRARAHLKLAGTTGEEALRAIEEEDDPTLRRYAVPEPAPVREVGMDPPEIMERQEPTERIVGSEEIPTPE